MEPLTKIKLITRTKTGRDAMGQTQYTETSRDVYAAMLSITRNEYFTAGQIGITPECGFVISSFDYKNEQLLEYAGRKYRIYRVYPASLNETELYCAYAAGANGG